MNTRSLPVRLLAALAFSIAFISGRVHAQSIFNDATNDIAAGISTGVGTLDIVKMEVVDTLTDVVFTMTVNGNLASTDWGNFMIGIANQKTPGTTTGNGWNRPINLNAGVTNGMTHWIGSWVNGPAGGAQLWNYDGTAWQEQTATPPGFVRTASAQSTVAYTVPKVLLGVTNGDTIIFDAYSSGGGSTDSAVDALSNPNSSITNWAGPYTSSIMNKTPGVGIGQTCSYTLANTALNVTTDVTFSVDMRAQVAIGTFKPSSPPVGGNDTAQSNNASIPSFAFSLAGPATQTAPAEDALRQINFVKGRGVQDAHRLYYDTYDGFTVSVASMDIVVNGIPTMNVTYTTDRIGTQFGYSMAPGSKTPQAVGMFPSGGGIVDLTIPGDTVSVYWGTDRRNCIDLKDPDLDGIYTGTVSITAPNGTPVPYYYEILTSNPSAPAISENVARGFTMQSTPPVLGTVFFNNAPDYRNVTFTVDMSVQETAGAFNPATQTVEVRGPFNNWAGTPTTAQGGGLYSATILIGGADASSVEYKYFTAGQGASGYESIAGNRTFTLEVNPGGAPNPPQVLPAVFFNDQSAPRNVTTDVTFSVDMRAQVAIGTFKPSSPPVGGNGAGRTNSASIPSFAFSLAGGTLNEEGNIFVEDMNGQSISMVRFPNGRTFHKLCYNSAITSGLFDSIEIFVNGRHSMTVSFDASRNNTQFGISIVEGATAPQAVGTWLINQTAPIQITIPGDIVSAYWGTDRANYIDLTDPDLDGIYTGTVSITAPNGTPVPYYYEILTSTPPHLGISESVARGFTMQSTPLVLGTVFFDNAPASVNGYSSWLTNYPSLTGTSTNGTADPDGDGFNNNLEFSFDGNPTVGTPSLMTVRPVGTNAVFNWVQRTSGVGYEVQKNSSLTNTWTAALGLSISNSTNQSGLLIPADYIRREFIVPASGKDFYRVRATITNN